MMAFICHYRSKFTSVTLISIAIIISLSSAALSRSLEEDRIKQMFEIWMVDYSRNYGSSGEKEHRFGIFKQNVEYVEAFNSANNHSYTLAVNQFADLTHEEFVATYTGYKGHSSTEDMSSGPFRYENVTEVPSSIDWRLKGAVTEVKNQGECGSCWAFAVVAAIEGVKGITDNNLTSLSVQELIDCDTKGTDEGCAGGLIETGYNFTIHNGGIVSEKKYPYKAMDEKCKKSIITNPIAKINGYENVTKKSEAALQKAVAHQPVSVAIEATLELQLYGSGVFAGDCGTDLNHAVTAIGYGVSKEKGKKYWLVKNSWGVKWGEKGYVRMEKDIHAKEGLCGIAMRASYPTMK